MTNKFKAVVFGWLLSLVSAVVVAQPVPTISQGELTVGIDLTYAPYAYLDNGEASGFDPDFMRLLAKKLGKTVVFKDTRIENIVIGLNANHYDVVASALYVNPQRAKQVDFLPYLQTGGVLLVRGDDPFRPEQLDALCGKRVSSMKGASWISRLNALSESYCLPRGLGAISVKEFPSAPEAGQALLAKGVDVQYEDAAVAQDVVTALQGRLAISTPQMIDPVLIGLALNKGNSALKLAIQTAMTELRASGEYERLLKKYNLAYPSAALLEANKASLSEDATAALVRSFNWGYLSTLFYKQAFWDATLTVIELSTLTWLFSGILGFVLAQARLSSRKTFSVFSGAYIWFFRSLPLLVLLIFIYNLPQAFPASSVVLSSPFMAGLIALVLSETAYMAEIHRGALQAIPKGQLEAARALGIRFLGVQKLVVIPQAFRIALPALANQYVTIIKLTSLVSVISLTEILLVGQQLYTRNFLVMETLVAVAFYYVLVVSLVTWGLRQFERRLDISRKLEQEDDSLVLDREQLTEYSKIKPAQVGEFAIEVRQAQKAFSSKQVLDKLDLTVRWGEVTALIGPSGSGKTTLIRSINGLEVLDAGDIYLEGRPFLQGGAQHAETADYWQRIVHVGMVFQSYNLFAHKTVLENVLLAPLYHGLGTHSVLRLNALALLDKVGLLAHAQKYPHQLSGGQQQRVAIARALAMRPSVMLFDEPTSALDPEWVNDVLGIIENLAKEGMTLIIVTHEMKFAFTIADRIVFMEHGKIVHDASPAAFQQIKDARLAAFLKPESASDYVI